MVLNVLDPSQTRYIVRAEELEAFLQSKYEKDHPKYNFNVEHVCDRWTFEAPDELEEEEIQEFIDNLVEERNRAAGNRQGNAAPRNVH